MEAVNTSGRDGRAGCRGRPALLRVVDERRSARDARCHRPGHRRGPGPRAALQAAQHDGISQWFEEVKDLWEGFEVHVERTAEIDGAVVAFLHLVAHQGGRASDARIGVICRMRDHKIVSITGRDADEIAEEMPGGAMT